MAVPSACEVIAYHATTTSGKPIRIGRRTAAHLDWTQDRLTAEFPGARIRIIQGTYNTGVDASKGTHDFDRCLDVFIQEPDGSVHEWMKAQKFLRRHGWAAWFRSPADSPDFKDHIHMVTVGGADCPVGEFVPGQLVDYRNHAFGLRDRHTPNSDTSWFPPDIDATIFDYESYMEEQMGYRDWAQEDKDALVADIVRGIMSFDVKRDPTDEVTAREALLRAFNTPDILREMQQDA